MTNKKDKRTKQRKKKQGTEKEKEKETKKTGRKKRTKLKKIECPRYDTKQLDGETPVLSFLTLVWQLE